MDYDETEIPATYDKARALTPETIRLWRGLLSAHIDRTEMSLVIDLGCGTGRCSELLASHFAVRVIGIDPSLKMLNQARRKPTIENLSRQSRNRCGQFWMIRRFTSAQFVPATAGANAKNPVGAAPVRCSG